MRRVRALVRRLNHFVLRIQLNTIGPVKFSTFLLGDIGQERIGFGQSSHTKSLSLRKLRCTRVVEGW